MIELDTPVPEALLTEVPVLLKSLTSSLSHSSRTKSAANVAQQEAGVEVELRAVRALAEKWREWVLRQLSAARAECLRLNGGPSPAEANVGGGGGDEDSDAAAVEAALECTPRASPAPAPAPAAAPGGAKGGRAASTDQRRRKKRPKGDL